MINLAVDLPVGGGQGSDKHGKSLDMFFSLSHRQVALDREASLKRLQMEQLQRERIERLGCVYTQWGCRGRTQGLNQWEGGGSVPCQG